MVKKVRIDKLLVEREICHTRERARALILSGVVLVGETLVDKASTLVPIDAEVRVKGETHPYVSRGGVKLRDALKFFGIDVSGMVILDVGASTGGFTDCLLHHGAKKVYALDVGYGQLAWKLRIDPRVVCLEKTNIRFFDGTAIKEPIHMVTIDTSFISLKLVIPSILKVIRSDDLHILALIKPQFEVGRKEVGKGGVVRDPALHERIIREIWEFCTGLGLLCVGVCESSLTGPAGNKEFFIYMRTGRSPHRPQE